MWVCSVLWDVHALLTTPKGSFTVCQGILATPSVDNYIIRCFTLMDATRGSWVIYEMGRRRSCERWVAVKGKLQWSDARRVHWPDHSTLGSDAEDLITLYLYLATSNSVHAAYICLHVESEVAISATTSTAKSSLYPELAMDTWVGLNWCALRVANVSVSRESWEVHRTLPPLNLWQFLLCLSMTCSLGSWNLSTHKSTLPVQCPEYILFTTKG